MAVNLSASTYFVPDSTSTQYLNYGAAVSEVKIKLYCYPFFFFPRVLFCFLPLFPFHKSTHGAVLLALRAEYFTVACLGRKSQ